jgi:serine/threonine protein kinase
LHKHDIAHRDIKPANIFKDRLTGFKLGDLNVSKILPQGSMTKTRAGSPFYISPEVWNHEDEGYSFKCDIWSLGIVIYELCCLKVPFEVDSPEEMIQQLKLTRKKSLPRYYSTELHEVVEKMLEIDPKKRITAVAIIQICLKNLKIDTERKGTESVLMKTIVVPETKERWVNLIHFVQRKDKRSISSRKSTEIYSRKSDLPVEMPPLEEDKNLLMVPQMMKRTSRTSKGSRESRESRDVSKSKENDAKLPPLRKYSVDIDYSNLSSLIEKKSDNCSKNSDRPNDLGLRSSRVRRNIVCEYIKEVREDLASLND